MWEEEDEEEETRVVLVLAIYCETSAVCWIIRPACEKMFPGGTAIVDPLALSTFPYLMLVWISGTIRWRVRRIAVMLDLGTRVDE